MELKTIKGVPIVSTGTYPLGSGETTFTADDLASAVLAASDPTVVAPRIGIGHTDERFDGEPAMGTVQNLTLTDDGQTVLGDLTDVPAWLADSMPSAYPGRSIEGGFNFKAPSGRDYKLVISNLKLLGTTWPGVTSLADLRQLMERNGTVEPVAASHLAGGSAERAVSQTVEVRAAGPGNRTAKEREEMAEAGSAMADGSFPIGTVGELESAIHLARTDTQRAHVMKRAKALGVEAKIPTNWRALKAAIDLSALPRRFALDLEGGKVPKAGTTDQAKWWARSVQAEDDGKLSILVDTDAGELLTLPITVAEDSVEYGQPVAVAASHGALDTNLKGPRVLASWPSHTAARPRKGVMRINADIDRAKVAQRLGLPEDADDAAINEALGVETATTPAPGADAAGSGEPGNGADPAVASGKLPEGVVAIDAAKLAELEAGAQAGATINAKLGPLGEQDRDQSILAAIKGGRIVAASRETWEQRWKAAPEETKKLLTAKVKDGGLAAVIPVEQIEAGMAGDGEGSDPAASATRFLPELQEAAA